MFLKCRGHTLPIHYTEFYTVFLFFKGRNYENSLVTQPSQALNRVGISSRNIVPVTYISLPRCISLFKPFSALLLLVAVEHAVKVIICESISQLLSWAVAQQVLKTARLSFHEV